MQNTIALGLQSVANHEANHKGNAELAAVLNSAVNEIERLTARAEKAEAENERLKLVMAEAMDPTLDMHDMRAIIAGGLGWSGPVLANQQQPPSCDKAPNKHHYLMPSGQCSCQDQSWAK